MRDDDEIQRERTVGDAPPSSARSLPLFLLCGCCPRVKRSAKSTTPSENATRSISHTRLSFQNLPAESVQSTARGDAFETARTSHSVAASERSDGLPSMSEIVRQVRREAGCADGGENGDGADCEAATKPRQPQGLHVEDLKLVTECTVIMPDVDDRVVVHVVDVAACVDDAGKPGRWPLAGNAPGDWPLAVRSAGGGVAWLLDGATLLVRAACHWLSAAVSNAFQRIF